MKNYLLITNLMCETETGINKVFFSKIKVFVKRIGETSDCNTEVNCNRNNSVATFCSDYIWKFTTNIKKILYENFVFLLNY